MARGTLHASKPADQRRRRNAPAHDEVVVRDDGELRGPELAGTWDATVLEWYETWRRSPQAQLFEATDWQRLRTLAPIVQAYFRRPSAAALSEIRMNEERLGATHTDRMRARIRVERDDEQRDAAPVLSIADRRSDLAARLRSSDDDKEQ